MLLSFQPFKCKEEWVGGNYLGSLYPHSWRKKLLKRWTFLNELLHQFIKLIFDSFSELSLGFEVFTDFSFLLTGHSQRVYDTLRPVLLHVMTLKVGSIILGMQIDWFYFWVSYITNKYFTDKSANYQKSLNIKLF